MVPKVLRGNEMYKEENVDFTEGNCERCGTEDELFLGICDPCYSEDSMYEDEEV